MSEESKITDYEQGAVVPLLALWLSTRKGPGKVVDRNAIARYIRGNGLRIENDIHIRAVINHMRVCGIVPCLVANSRGYYVAVDAGDVERYVLSLRKRAAAMEEVAAALERQGSKLKHKEPKFDFK